MAQNTQLDAFMLAIAFEDMIKPETTLPEQFQRLWNGAHSPTPECALMHAILLQACDDLCRFRRGAPRATRRIHDEALRWFASEDRTWVFSFRNVCDVLDLSPALVRAVLKIGSWGAASPSRRTAPDAAA
jgi:hypothetical protein